MRKVLVIFAILLAVTQGWSQADGDESPLIWSQDTTILIRSSHRVHPANTLDTLELSRTDNFGMIVARFIVSKQQIERARDAAQAMLIRPQMLTEADADKIKRGHMFIYRVEVIQRP